MSRPTLGVIIPCYNAEKTLGRLFDSIIEQNWDKEDLEIILCDDKSTDRSLDIVYQYHDKLNIQVTSTNREIHCPNNTRKRGFHAATAQWITFCDNDDAFEPMAFQTIVNHIHNTNETRMVCSNFREWKDDKYTKEFIRTETWTHGKWFNLDWCRENNIDYIDDLLTHEDLYFNSLVLGHLIGQNTDYNYCDIFTYKWIYRADSLSRQFYDNNRLYIDKYLNDYITAIIEPNFQFLHQYPLCANFYINQILMCLLHCYFYYQSQIYRLGFEDAAENYNHIKNLYHNIKINLHMSANQIIEYIYTYPQRYINIKKKCIDSTSVFLECQSFQDFILQLDKL